MRKTVWLFRDRVAIRRHVKIWRHVWRQVVILRYVLYTTYYIENIDSTKFSGRPEIWNIDQTLRQRLRFFRTSEQFRHQRCLSIIYIKYILTKAMIGIQTTNNNYNLLLKTSIEIQRSHMETFFCVYFLKVCIRLPFNLKESTVLSRHLWKYYFTCHCTTKNAFISTSVRSSNDR